MLETLAVRPVDAARAIGVSRSHLYALLKGGLLPSVRIGKSIRIPVDALRGWIKQNQSMDLPGTSDIRQSNGGEK